MVTSDGAGEPDTRSLRYAENHCALRWPLVWSGLYAPLLGIALAVLSVAYRSWIFFAAFMISFAFWPFMRGMMLPYLRPTGIRIGPEGVRIGGVRWAERHPGRVRGGRKTVVIWQCAQVFACPWDGVASIGVTTNRRAIKILIRRAYYGRKLTPLGNLASPFMRAALVMRVELDMAQLPKIRPDRNPLGINYSSPGYHQPLWVVPTRHPKKLAAALTLLPLFAGTVGDPFPDDGTEIGVPDEFDR
jgi:hypothetical protein